MNTTKQSNQKNSNINKSNHESDMRKTMNSCLDLSLDKITDPSKIYKNARSKSKKPQNKAQCELVVSNNDDIIAIEPKVQKTSRKKSTSIETSSQMKSKH